MWLVKRQSELGQMRDPRAATVPISQPVMGRRYAKWNAEAAAENGLYQQIYVYACARARAQDLSSLPIRVGADPDKPKDFDPNHPIAKLLGPAPGGPTMNISSRKLIAWTSIQFDIAGRFSWEIAPPAQARRDGVPFELWPLTSSKLTPIPSGGSSEWWAGFEYEVNAKRVRLSTDQVLYYWRPKADDFREPESLLEAAKLNVSVAVMQDKYDYAFLQNDARPASVVVHEAFEEKDERDGFRRQFLDSHRGPENAGKVAFVETTVDGATPKDSLLIQNLGLSQRDAEFIERYENQIRAINVAFATPLSRLADSSRRTYANAERETLNYWRNAIKPQAVEVAEALNTTLMPMLGDSGNVCWFDTTGITELEPPRRYAVGDIPALIQSRVITRNEARTGLELAAVDGGDDWEAEVAPVAPPVPAVEGERTVDWALIAAEAQPSWARTVAIIHDQVVDSLHRRAGGKRGRQQATLPGDTLFEEDYWLSRMMGMFSASAHSLYSTVVATLRTAGLSVGNDTESTLATEWCEGVAATAAQSLIDVYSRDLNRIKVEDVGYWDNMPRVTVDDVRAVVDSAVAVAGSDTISASLAEKVLGELDSGSMSVDAALEKVDRGSQTPMVINVNVTAPAVGGTKRVVRDADGRITGLEED